MKFPLIHLLLVYFILLLEKMFFYSKKIHYAYNFYGTNLNVCTGTFRTQSNIYDGAFLQKLQNALL